MEAIEKLEDGEECYKAVFWTWHGYRVREVIIAVAAYTGPAQDQVSQNSRTDGKLLYVDSCWERKSHSLFMNFCECF